MGDDAKGKSGMSLLAIITGFFIVIWGVVVWIKSPLSELMVKRDYPIPPEERARRFEKGTPNQAFAVLLICFGAMFVVAGFFLQ